MTNLEQTFLESATRYFRESQSKEIDWEQRRYEIAKDVLIAWYSNPNRIYKTLSPENCTKEAVEVADALIEELKKEIVMLIKEYFYNIECDCCKTLADDSSWCADPEGAKEVADDNSWRTLGGKHYCPKCWHYGDDDNIYTNDGNIWDGDTEEPIR
nr:MAG TPA: hypothetical protein [Bacteriophage sp.]